MKKFNNLGILFLYSVKKCSQAKNKYQRKASKNVFYLKKKITKIMKIYKNIKNLNKKQQKNHNKNKILWQHQKNQNSNWTVEKIKILKKMKKKIFNKTNN